MRIWARDLALGARFAVSGGRAGWARTILTTVGVALGVVILLLAASAPNVIARSDERGEAREPACNSECGVEKGPDSILVRLEYTEFRGADITGYVLQPEAGAATTATPPPGLDAFPAPGELIVSPALESLLRSGDSELLAERLDPDAIAGTIGQQGLKGAGEHYFYLGSDSLSRSLAASGDASEVVRIDSWGRDWLEEEMDPALMLLITVICVVLLMPVAVFIATAARFGGERRDRRLAALRLVGADVGTARRVTAGESLVGALAGLGLGAIALLPIREYLGSITMWGGYSAFPSDFVPNVALAVLFLLGVPVTAVAVSLMAMRGVTIEPLGVVRRSAPVRRRLAWRLLPCAVGTALLLPLTRTFSTADDLTLAQAAVGMVLLLAGVTLLLPWLVERLVNGLRGGPLSWQMAVRRLQISSGSAARPVSGITVAVAGAIALYMLFSGVRTQEREETGLDTASYQMEVSAFDISGAEGARLRQKMEAVPGTEDLLTTTSVVGVTPRPGALRDEDYLTVIVADCEAMHSLVRIDSCADGDVFRAHTAEDTAAKLPDPGERIELHPVAEGSPAKPLRWRVPEGARTAVADSGGTGFSYNSAIYATPAALDTTALASTQTTTLVSVDPGDDDVIEHLRNISWGYEPHLGVWEREREIVSDDFRDIQTGLLIGASGVMLLIGASMIVTMVEQLRERKRLLSILVAFGTRRRSLGASVLWQTAIPVVLGLGLATVVGSGLGVILMRMVDLPVEDWLTFLPMAGVGAGVIAFVTLVSMPFLWRLMRPDGLRTE